MVAGVFRGIYYSCWHTCSGNGLLCRESTLVIQGWQLILDLDEIFSVIIVLLQLIAESHEICNVDNTNCLRVPLMLPLNVCLISISESLNMPCYVAVVSVYSLIVVLV
ncbi:hypothetical protein S245_058082 [Arachis hypogaea]